MLLPAAVPNGPSSLNFQVPSSSEGNHSSSKPLLDQQSTITQQQTFPITIVSRLMGETGNWLQYIIKVKTLQWRLRDKYGIPTSARYQVRQSGKKCIECIDFIQRCFPNLGEINFDEKKLSHPNFLGKVSVQRQSWLDNATIMQNSRAEDDHSLLDLDIEDDTSAEEEDEKLQRVHHLVRTYTPTLGLRNISLPFVHVEAFASPRDYSDYYDELRTLLEFDDEKCCGLVPDPQAFVFHFRGYQTEESVSKSRQFGREELSPQKVASDLFQHLGPGDQLSLLSRFDASAQLVQSHIQELESKGVRVQFVHQSTAQDFCYLRHAQKELVGLGYSTFVRLAGFLAKFRPKVRLYCLESQRAVMQQKCQYFDFSREKHGSLQDSYVSEVFS